MVQALQSALESIEPNPHLKLITIEGDGPDFSFGASVPEHAPDEIARVLPEMHALIERLLDAPAVTAAIVRGRCLGGGFELALACDFIFAAADAVMGLPEIALGVFPPAASALLPVRIGAARATRAIVTGEAHRA
ncbi:MAG: cyclohexa-1,5-dienecarbonyl-CoA hydratase, partial [Acidobacteria bacterium]